MPDNDVRHHTGTRALRRASVPPSPPEAGSGDGAKRRQILEGARQVFRGTGFDGASMGEIARAAGVSKGTLYVYFPSKEALFEALTLLDRRELAEGLFSLDEDGSDVAAVLRALGRSLLAMMARPEHISSVRMVIGATDKFPRIGQVFYEAGPLHGRERLRSYLDRQVAAGRLAVGDTDLAAEQFLDLCAASVLRRRLFGVEAGCGPEDVARSVDGAVTVFMAAYGPGSSRSAAATRA